MLNSIKCCLVILIIIKINYVFTQQQQQQQQQQKQPSKPHIILILADDMGFNDVSYHGSDQIPTPNIDALAYYGITMNKFYTAPMCTPSRSALLSGKYPSKIGMQHYVIASEQPWGLGLNEKLLPEYLREGGYNTHLIGKWHMGFYKKEYTPTFRGFDSHYGYLGPYVDYWDHTLLRTHTPYVFARGLDMRNNLTINYNTNGTYATDLFTDYAVQTLNKHNKNIPLFMYLSHLAPHSGNTDNPMQAPAADINKFNYIKDINRRTYAAMVSKLDDSVGQLMQALKDNNMLDNTIILFISDNGSPSIGENANYGSNYPFRGQKDSPWEGAVRTNAIIWSAQLNKKQRVSNELYHITDIFKTLIDMADVKISDKSIDGKNIWESLSNNIKSPRNEILCNYDQDIGYVSYIFENWKFINGTTYIGKYDYWIGLSIENTTDTTSSTEFPFRLIESITSTILLPYANDGINIVNVHDNINSFRQNATVSCFTSKYSKIINNNCNPLDNPCLFNLDNDPCEENNLANVNVAKLKELEQKLQIHLQEAIAPRNRPSDPKSNPSQFNYTWTWWYDELGLIENVSIVRFGYYGVVMNYGDVKFFRCSANAL